MSDKERIGKLQKKLQQRKLTVQEALQEEVSVEWLKTNHPAFLSMLTPEAMAEIIDLLITPGPPNDKMRSYKIPMVAADLLSAMVPKVYELFFMEDPALKPAPLLTRLLSYFSTQSNYVISGYVVRILMNLIPANPSRVIEHLFKSSPERMLSYLESQSIAQLLLRITIVEDALLNCQIKERVALLGNVVKLYVENNSSEQILTNANWLLGQAILRLWSQKHKQLGRFSATLFKLVEAVIDHNNLHHQENLIVIICKQVAIYQKEAPFLISALYKKLYNELAAGRGDIGGGSSGRPRLTVRRYKYLQAMHFLLIQGGQAISKQLINSNIYPLLLDYIPKYQWHSLGLVEIQKILKMTILSSSPQLLDAAGRSNLTDRLSDLVKAEGKQGKFGCGYKGVVTNIATTLQESIISASGYGGWLKEKGRDEQALGWLSGYLGKTAPPPSRDIAVVHEVTKPRYNLAKLPTVFAQFFAQTEQINKRMQSESPSKQHSSEKDVLQQIQNENELVYKLLSQVVSQTTEEKKSEDAQ